MCSDRISCVEKLLISPKFILIKFGNGFVHQTSHVFSLNGVLHDMRQTACFSDDWRRDKMLSTSLTIIIHDTSCRYGNFLAYQRSLIACFCYFISSSDKPWAQTFFLTIRSLSGAFTMHVLV